MHDHACMHGWMDGRMDGCVYVCMYVCMYVHMYIHVFICTYICICLNDIDMYLCKQVCMYACMYACMHVCMYVWLVQMVCIFVMFAIQLFMLHKIRGTAWYGVVWYGLAWYRLPSPKPHPDELRKSRQILRRATQIWCDFGVPTEAWATESFSSLLRLSFGGLGFSLVV